MTRRAFTLLEALVVAAVLTVLLSALWMLFSASQRSSSSLTVKASLQKSSRQALATFITETQEGMEVLLPRPGRSRAQAAIRDRLSLIRWYAQRPQPGADGLYELWRYTADRPQGERLFGGIKRLRFTCRSEGALEVNLVLTEEGQDTALLTTIRLRNLPSAEAVW